MSQTHDHVHTHGPEGRDVHSHGRQHVNATDAGHVHGETEHSHEHAHGPEHTHGPAHDLPAEPAENELDAETAAALGLSEE